MLTVANELYFCNFPAMGFVRRELEVVDLLVKV
jgi:hypothetical protein